MIHGDGAIGDPSGDHLGRDDAAQALKRLLAAAPLETPLTVGILGGWGTGKTSLMRLLKQHLDEDENLQAGGSMTLWFDAWAYARQEKSLWRALLLSIIHDLKTRARLRHSGQNKSEDSELNALLKALETLETSLYRSSTERTHDGLKVNWGAGVPWALDAALRFASGGLSDIAADPDSKAGPIARLAKLLKGEDLKEVTKLIEQKTRETYVEEVRSLEQFRATFEGALALAGIGARTSKVGEPGKPTGRLYLFVDDLDRCLPDDAVAAVEAIKLFLDVPGCVFILGMDGDVIQTGIRARYRAYFTADGSGPFRPEDYLDKVIQLPFRLPPLEPAQVKEFLSHFVKEDVTGLTSDTRDLIEIAVPDNPRTLKRVLNVLALAAQLDGSADGVDGEAAVARRRRQRRLIAKVVLLQVCFADTYREVAAKGIPELKRLEQQARSSQADAKAIPPRLRALLSLKLSDQSFESFADDPEVQKALSLSRRFDALPTTG